ncbi:TetR family transcriptional regulator [Brachybacterium phenoliresistens]|uniref:TetR family transcriptional regulator n=1 Tax=Brachybacterium phenoliresistens TaxID=396014 RepID=Z9JU62_9MICO|nr:TetR family transcriptional regulator [Brachybacterium phenoliresistens]
MDAEETTTARAAPAAPGLRELKKKQTREAMHRAALELVVEHGYANVTAEMIARRAGVSTRTFFNHWSTKESAILGILTGQSDSVVTRLVPALEELPHREALRQVMRDTLAAVPSDPELRDLKKEVMAREPKLHSISTGNLHTIQNEMVDILTGFLEGEDARERAFVIVQLAFALTRSAFAVAMARGIELTAAFDEVVELYDSGRADI